jgi:hypothetical protein
VRALKQFSLMLIKPSHYDDDGYVIQWFRSAIPSNSLRAAGVPVCIRGFHVSGCLSMLPAASGPWPDSSAL